AVLCERIADDRGLGMTAPCGKITGEQRVGPRCRQLGFPGHGDLLLPVTKADLPPGQAGHHGAPGVTVTTRSARTRLVFGWLLPICLTPPVSSRGGFALTDEYEARDGRGYPCFPSPKGVRQA